MKIPSKLSFILCTALVVSLAPTYAAKAANILLIESYHSGYDWDILYKTALIEHLPDHVITTFEMDTKRLPKEKHKEKADEAWAKYNEVKPDIVILGDDNALKYLGPRFIDTPANVVFLGINNNPREYFEGKRLPENFTGILERPLINRSIAEIKRLLPNAEKVLVLFDDGITSRNSITLEMKEGRIGNVAVNYKLLGADTDWKNAVKTAKPNGFDAIVIGLYQTLKNGNGEPVPDNEILSWTNKNTEVPLFALWNFSVGKGKTCGGIVLDGYKMGEAAAAITEEVLAGKDPHVRINQDGAKLFSRSELDRWHIKIPKSLMEEATILE